MTPLEWLVGGHTPTGAAINRIRASGWKMPDCDSPIPLELFEGQAVVHSTVTPAGLKVIYVPCRKCVACLRVRRRAWYARMRAELELAPRTWFLTLTFADSDTAGAYVEVQRFLKRLRKSLPRCALRYVAVLEAGDEGGRLHWHMLLHCYAKVTKRMVQAQWSRVGFSGCKLATVGNCGYLSHYAAGAMLRVHASKSYGRLR